MILGIAPCITHIGTIDVQASASAGSGSYAVGGYNNWGEIVGEWSYNDGNQDVYQSNASLLSKLPYEGTVYRHTTANYDANNGAFDTSNWATSFMWDLTNSNPYSMTVYAIPLAFRAGLEGGASNVIQVTAPSSLSDTANNTYTMQMPANGSLTDFAIQPSFNTSDAKVDAITDWTYDVVLQDASDNTRYLKTTMVQGSIFAYFQLYKDTTLTIDRPRTLPATVIYNQDGMLVIRCMDNMDGDYDYYAFYAASGTTFTPNVDGTTINDIAVSFPSEEKAYMSMAYLGANPTSPDDNWGISMAEAYKPYAYNFVTDTKATYSFNEATATVTTTYTYTVEKKVENAPEGTIMGVLPHQYKNMSASTPFMPYTCNTIRGTMKLLAGSSFTTNLKYSGILPFMPDYTDDDTEEATISKYLLDYTNQFSNDYFENYEGSGDTYWDGKGLNRLGNAMVAAETAGDTATAKKMYQSLKTHLNDWFTYSGEGDERYFYYDEDLGALFGFPQSYSSVDQINDHHFHYGYFIYAAAQVAMREQKYEGTNNWISEYGGMVQQLIDDIACDERNSASSKYPYMRNFAPYEGHSWASGHANFEMGNNQESSSEALNAWAGIILWGEATQDVDIRELGVYLYTTEISAVQNYWYDVEENVLSDAYRYGVNISEINTVDKTTAKVKNNSAAIVWGGSYTYATWFSANPLYIQGINLLPMNPTCFYLAGDADYIQENWDLAYEKASAAGWDMESWIDIWCQYYAMAFPEDALEEWKNAEEGTGSYGVEGGDTKAHTYHFIKAMCEYGTPDTSITSNSTLSTVFVKDGVKTYCAYNTGDSPLTVTFSDGYKVTVPARSMEVETEGEGSGQAKYTVEYYVQSVENDETYTLETSEELYGTVGDEVTYTEENVAEMKGYVFDAENANNNLSLTVKASENDTIKLYYDRAEYNITYVLNGGNEVEGNPETYRYKDSILLLESVKTGYNFTGWYTDAALSNEITMIQDTDMGDLTLYAGWQDPYEYDLDATKKVTYDDGIITITVRDVDADDNVLAYVGYYTNYSDVESITSASGVGGLGGHSLTYDETEKVWKISFTAGFSANQYMVFKVNVIRNGVGDESAWGVYQIPDESETNAVTYYENFYKENLDGTYSLAETVKKKGAENENVTCSEMSYTGFTEDADNVNRVVTGTLSSSSVTTLKRYYNRNVYTITYDLGIDACTNSASNPATYTYGSTINMAAPTYTGDEDYVFIKWYTDSACTSAFTGITPTTTGNITLYAKWVNADETPADYTVNHYKQDAVGSSSYSLAQTETLSAKVGQTVYATAIDFTGYTENASHISRVASGKVLEDGSLTLKLYYDVTGSSSYATPDNGGYSYADGKVTFYCDDVTTGLVYVALYSDEATAIAKASAGNAASDAGFTAVTGHAGYSMSENNGRAEYAYTMSEGQYFVYALNPANQGVEEWYVGVATASTSSDTDTKVASYTVEHYKQDSASSASYTKADTETLSGTINAKVTATAKKYSGYKENTSHGSRVASGTVLADGSLVLKLYYDVDTTVDESTPLNGGYTYDADAKTLTFTYTTAGLLYIAMYDSQDKAQTAADAANAAIEASQGDGLNKLTSPAGYDLVANGDGTYSCTIPNVTADKAFAYCLKVNTVIDKYYVGTATEKSDDDDGGDGGDINDPTYDTPENGGYVYENSALTFYNESSVTVYVASYASEDAAKEALDAANATDNGLTELTNPVGYPVGTEADGQFVSNVNIYNVSAGQYFVYGFTGGAKITWYMGYAGATENVVTKTTYTVEHYKQNTDLSTYTLVTSEVGTGTVGDAVTATTKTYEGFSVNATTSTTSGTLASEESLTLKIYYDRDNYTITYKNMSDGTNPNASTYTYGVGLTFEEPTRDGYTFGGWYLDENLTASTTSISTTAIGAVTVYAKWVAVDNSVSYKVEYYLQNTALTDYDLKTTKTLKAAEGTAVTADTAVEYTGFTFDDDNGNNVLSSASVASDTVLKVYYNRNSYDIQYMNVEDADNTANAATYVYGVGITFASPIKDNFIFGGWYTDETLQTPVTAIGTDKAEDVTVYAKWTAVEEDETIVTYTVAYYQQDLTLEAYAEDPVATVTLSGLEGTEVTADTTVTYPGFTLNTEAEGTCLSGTLSEDTLTELKVYYDRNTYGITYENMADITNADENVSEYIYGAGLVFVTPPEREGYSFGGWYFDSNFTTLATAIGADETGDVTVYAKWIADEPVECTYNVKYYLETSTDGKYAEVTADKYSGTGMEGVTVNAVEKEYYGYAINREAGGTVLSGSLVADATLELKVYYDRATYDVIYHLNGEMDETVMNPDTNAATYEYGKGFTFAEPVREGYDFAGWYKDSEFTTRIVRITNSQAGNVDVYAKWTPQQTEYTVRYYIQNITLDGYTEVAERAFNKTADVGEVVNAIDAEYDIDLEGFELNESQGVLSGTVSKSEALVLKLYYDRKTYGITYNNIDVEDTNNNAASYVYGVGLTLQEPEKAGKVFLGWYTDSSFAEESKIAEISASTAGDINLYAKWEDESAVKNYVVAYYLQDTDLNGYSEYVSARYSGKGELGATVSAPIKEFTGFEANPKAEGYLASTVLAGTEEQILSVYYDRLKYAVKYYNMEEAENATTNGATYIYGVGLTLASPKRAGYLFKGWYTDSACSTENIITEISNTQTGVVTLYAKWEKYVPETDEPEDMDDGFTVDTIEDQYYTGSKIVPSIVVKDGDKVLTEKKDYTLKFKDNTNAGNATVTITGKGNYTGSTVKTFEIKKRSISGEEFSVADIYVAHKKNDAHTKIAPKLTYGKKTLKLGKDYTIEGAASYGAKGNYTVKLVGKGNYDGERYIDFVITDQVLMSKVKIDKIPNQYYNQGKAIEPAVTVSYKKDILNKGSDYTVEYSNNTSAGTATVTVRGNGTTYVGVKTITFKITGTQLKSMPIELEGTEFEYTGDAICPAYYTGDLQPGVDYTVSYKNNVKVGKATVTFTGTGAYTGTVSKTFKITPYNIANNEQGLFEDITGDITMECGKVACKPTVNLTFDGKTMVEGTDYTLSYKNNNKIGKASVIIKGKGKYTGSITKYFDIKENDMDSIVLMPEDIIVKNNQKASYYMAKLTVVDENGKKLTAGKDYDKNSIVYSYTVDGKTTEFNKDSVIGDLPVGTVLQVSITGINSYKGTITAEYRVVSASIKSAKFSIPNQTYSGFAVTLDESDITLNGGPSVTFEIVEGTYINNVKKGTAKVTLRGTGDYGGYKTVSFKIGQKSLSDAIAGIFGL